MRTEDRLPVPMPLPPGPVLRLGSLRHARRETPRMEDGVMGGMRHARMGGRTTGIEEVAATGKTRAFNSTAEMPDVPFFTAWRGETLLIRSVNDTA